MLWKTGIICTILIVAASRGAAQQTSAPQRTIVSRTETAPLAAQDANSGPAAALERYREMWQKMSPAQQKTFLDAGGYTPDQYERTLKEHGARGAGAGDKQIDRSALESLTKSLQNLDAIRDANLNLVQKDGCPPEIAARLADLKNRLQSYEYELNGAASSALASAGARPAEKSSSEDALALARDWFQRPANKVSPEAAATGSESSGAGSRETKLLEAAFAGAQLAAVPGGRLDPKPDQARRKVIQQDTGRIKAELAQLSEACPAPKK
jgi:hypothetical protein